MAGNSEEAEFTPEQLAKGRQVTEYYQNLDESDPANQPTEDETKTRIFKNLVNSPEKKEE